MRKVVLRPTWDFNGNGNGVQYVPDALKEDFRKQSYFQTTYDGMWMDFSEYLESLAKNGHSDDPDAFMLLARNSENLGDGKELFWAIDELGYVRTVKAKRSMSLPRKKYIVRTDDGSPISDDGYRIINDFFREIIKATYGFWRGVLRGSEDGQDEIIRFLKKEGYPYKVLDEETLLEYLPGLL